MTRRRDPYYPVSGGKATPRERRQTGSGGLDQEIDLLRFYIRRVVMKQDEAPDLIEAAGVLRSISIALFSLTQLIHTHQVLVDAGEPVANELEARLTEIAQEMKAREKAAALEAGEK